MERHDLFIRCPVPVDPHAPQPSLTILPPKSVSQHDIFKVPRAQGTTILAPLFTSWPKPSSFAWPHNVSTTIHLLATAKFLRMAPQIAPLFTSWQQPSSFAWPNTNLTLPPVPTLPRKLSVLPSIRPSYRDLRQKLPLGVSYLNSDHPIVIYAKNYP